MYYINLLLATLLLSACATTNTSTVTESAFSGKDPLEQSESELSQYTKAIVLLNNGNLNSAKTIFIEFNKERPELAGPYVNLAVIALREKKADKAYRLVKISLSRNPNLPQALNLLGYLEQTNGKIKLAEKYFKEAIKYNNNYATAHYNIALLYDIYFQDITRAIPHYEKYIKLTGNRDKNTADWLEQLKRTKENG